MLQTIYPLAFDDSSEAGGRIPHLQDPDIRKMAAFFISKGLPAIKREDRDELWYDDWIRYQASHQLYARLLAPKHLSTLGTQFDLLRLARFVEVFGYFSPAHAYSLHVSLLGILPILMSTNEPLKIRAVAALEAGGLFAFAVSERAHGSDLMANEFLIRETSAGRFLASGSKYHIGNANVAEFVSILARHQNPRSKRAPFAFFALLPNTSPGYQNVKKIRTLGVRAAFVGEFDVKDHEFGSEDIICDGRDAWDAMFATVNFGKFFLGFGSIGICEHAMYEAIAHLRQRTLYGAAAIEMPHLRSAAVHAYARLTAMKLFANRALEYLCAASLTDRRYQLFNAVQKAKVSTQGVKVMALLIECIGAKGFESETYFETALRDVQLIPGLEGSTHINHGVAAQFTRRYCVETNGHCSAAPATAEGATSCDENAFMFSAGVSSPKNVVFDDCVRAYRPLRAVPNVRLFEKAVRAMRLCVRAGLSSSNLKDDSQRSIALGKCIATIAYGQLIAEMATARALPVKLLNLIFDQLLRELSAEAADLASSPGIRTLHRTLLGRVRGSPRIDLTDIDFVAGLMAPAAAA